MKEQNAAKWAPPPTQIPKAWLVRPPNRSRQLGWGLIRTIVPFAGMCSMGWSAENALWLIAFNLIQQTAVIGTAKFAAPKLQLASKPQLIAESFLWGALSTLLAIALCAVGVAFSGQTHMLAMSLRDMIKSLNASLCFWLLILSMAAVSTFFTEVRVEIERSHDKGSWQNVAFSDVFSGVYAMAFLAVSVSPMIVNHGNISILIWAVTLTAFSIVIAVYPDQIRDNLMKAKNEKP